MNKSSWPSRRRKAKTKMPPVEPTMPPAGSDRDRRRDVVEDQERRDQKTAADPEHARQETHRRAHRQQDEDVDGNFRDREIDAHPSVSISLPVGDCSHSRALSHRKANFSLRRRGSRVKPRRLAETKNISIS
jgi:hypothetical protein